MGGEVCKECTFAGLKPLCDDLLTVAAHSSKLRRACADSHHIAAFVEARERGTLRWCESSKVAHLSSLSVV